MASLSLPSAPPSREERQKWLEELVSALADWLELTAFFDCGGQALFEDLVDSLYLGQDEEEEEIHEVGSAEDDITSAVAAEIDDRRRKAGDSYPFVISADGAVVRIRDDWSGGAGTYLLCLVLSHVSRSVILPVDFLPPAPELAMARNTLFECCATLAAAGFCEGPAFRLGASRGGAEVLLSKLREIWKHFGDGRVRETPAPGASEHVNDGGIDVIAWKPTPNNRAGTQYLLGQAASGNNWTEKSIKGPVIEAFHHDWFDLHPISTVNPATFIPFNYPADRSVVARRHGQIVDRVHLSVLVEKATKLRARGNGPIECVDSLENVNAWVRRHRDRVLKAEARP